MPKRNDSLASSVSYEQVEVLQTCVILIQRKELQHVGAVMESALRLAAVSLEIVKVYHTNAAECMPSVWRCPAFHRWEPHG